jgi:hypothetical protein
MIQRGFISLRTAMLNPNKLPGSVTIPAVLLIATHASFLLMNQPAGYWRDAGQAVADYPFRTLLTFGPWMFAGLVIAYLLVTSILLICLKRRFAMVLAGMQLSFHFIWICEVIEHGIKPFFVLTDDSNVGVLYYGLLFIWTIYLVIILVGLIGFAPNVLRLKHFVPSVRIAIASIWSLILVYGIARVSILPQSGWMPLAPENLPGPRREAAVAYDAKRQRAVLLGGVRLENGEWFFGNDTWEWDGVDWYQVKTSSGPSGRSLHAMAYDESLGVVLLYGGSNRNGALRDLWQWDGKEWQELHPNCNPASRMGHAMFYDHRLKKVISFGGYAEGIPYNSEAWVWDGVCWTCFPFQPPVPGLYGALAYDLDNERTIFFSGNEWGGGTWIWQENEWEKLDFDVEPPLRIRSTLTFDPDHKRSILFGGKFEDDYLSDTWIFEDETWTKLITSLSPPPMSHHVAFFDPVRRSVIIFGGDNYQRWPSNEMWELKIP